MNNLTTIALRLLKSDPDYLTDARKGAPVSNTVIGSVMNLTTGSPRQYTEQAVRDALDILDQEEG